MLKIRLMRVGMKGAPTYRVVVADARSPRDGRIVENIGWYNPRTEPSTINIDPERARYWLSVGAQLTNATQGLFLHAGLVTRSGRLIPAQSSAEGTGTGTGTATAKG